MTKKINGQEIFPIIKNNSKIEIYRQKLNYQKIKNDLNWYPKSRFNESLIKTIRWYKDNLSFFDSKFL